MTQLDRLKKKIAEALAEYSDNELNVPSSILIGEFFDWMHELILQVEEEEKKENK